MEISIDQVVPTPSGLRLGGVVEYGKGGPVRFVQVRIGWENFTPEVMRDLYLHLGNAWDRANEREPVEDEALPLDWA